mmetsp:Transcript_48666/g.117689  ORF Transcript_48666/g.117689 Transcript_48666/m.117689 type:complete len:230 (+) Transcript_48666:877-1566(+)
MKTFWRASSMISEALAAFGCSRKLTPFMERIASPTSISVLFATRLSGMILDTVKSLPQSVFKQINSIPMSSEGSDLFMKTLLDGLYPNRAEPYESSSNSKTLLAFSSSANFFLNGLGSTKRLGMNSFDFSLLEPQGTVGPPVPLRSTRNSRRLCSAFFATMVTSLPDFPNAEYASTTSAFSRNETEFIERIISPGRNGVDAKGLEGDMCDTTRARPIAVSLTLILNPAS